MKDQFKEFMANAQMAFTSGQYETALMWCKQSLTLEPGAVSANAMAANACFLLERLQESEKYFKKAIELDGGNGDYYFGLGNSLFGRQLFSEAMKYYSKAIQLGCSEEIKKKIYYLIGLINQRDGKKQDALLNYDKSDSFAGVNIDQADILLRRIQIYVEQRDLQKAEEYAIQLKLLIPSEFKSYQLLFQIYLEQKKIEQAEEVLQDALKYCPDESAMQAEIGFDKVILNCFMAEQNPGQMEKYYHLALGQLTELEQDKGLSVKDQQECIITKAEILVKLEQYEEAIALLLPVTVQTDDSLVDYIERSHYNLMCCYEQLQEYESVGKYARRMKDSKNIIYRHHGYYAEAYAMKKLAEKDPSWTDRSLKLYHIAIAYYKNSTVTSPGDFIAYLYRAKAYVDLGEFDRALEIGNLLPTAAQQQLQEYISKVQSH